MLDPPWWLKSMVTLALLVIAGFAMRLSRWSWADEVRGLSSLRVWGWVMAVLLVDLFLSLLFGGTERASGITQFRWYSQPPSSWQFLLALGLGPLVEESIFRQYLHGALAETLPMWLVASVTSVMFVLAHLLVLLSQGLASDVLLSAPGLLVAGLLLTLVRQKSAALFPCVIVHSGLNLKVLVLAGMLG